MGNCLKKEHRGGRGEGRRPEPEPEPQQQPLQPVWVLEDHALDVNTVYDCTGGEQLGQGLHGPVIACVHRDTGETLACKFISKSQGVSPRAIRNEVRIFHYLSGLPHIVRFIGGAYEDENFVQLVMERCSGGDLGTFIAKKGIVMAEIFIKRWFRQLVKAVHWCHLMGVAHCDIHPGNVLLSEDEHGRPFSLKLADFGASDITCTNRETLMANDVTSLGFILFSMLTGEVPISEARKEQIEEAASTGQLALNNASSSAKDLITQLFARAHRITTAQILEHPWIRVTGESNDLPIGFAFVARLREIRELNKIQRIALMAIAKNIPIPTLARYKEHLLAMYNDAAAPISSDELKSKLLALGLELSDSQIARLMEPGDLSHRVENRDFVEAIAAMIPRNECQTLANLRIAFEYFDNNKNGLLERSELEWAMANHEFGDIKKTVDEILEVERSVMDFQRFVVVMTDGWKPTACM